MFKFIGLDTNPLDYISRNTQQLLDSTVQTILVKTGFQSDNDSDYTSDKSQQQQHNQQQLPSSTHAKLNNNPLSTRRQLPTPSSASGATAATSTSTRQLPMVSGSGTRASTNSYCKSSSPSPEIGANIVNSLNRYVNFWKKKQKKMSISKQIKPINNFFQINILVYIF